MLTVRSSHLMLGLAVVGLVIALESVRGDLVSLTTPWAPTARGGGICYTELSANDESCPAPFGGTSCADEVCLRRTTTEGVVYYHCDRYYLQTQEYPGWKSSVNQDQQTGKSQHLTTDFKCMKRQDCKFGTNCAEVTDNGTIKWKCISDGAATFTFPHTHHWAGGSNCTKPS